MANNDKPTDVDIHTVAMLSVLDRWQCSFPGLVAQVADLEGRVLVQPAIRIRARNSQQLPPKPVLIPVAWPSWGVYGFQGKLAVGDEVLVRCQDKNWLAWLVTGGQVDDVAIGGHQSGYAVAEPVQLSKPRRLPPLPTGTALQVGTKDGATTVVFGDDGSISVQSGNVRLGAATTVPALAVGRDTDPVTVAAAYTAFISQVTALFNAPPGPMLSAPGSVTPVISTTVGTVAATSTEVTST